MPLRGNLEPIDFFASKRQNNRLVPNPLRGDGFILILIVNFASKMQKKSIGSKPRNRRLEPIDFIGYRSPSKCAPLESFRVKFQEPTLKEGTYE